MAKWTAVEINTGFISACLPTLRPFVEQIPLKLMSLGSWTVASNNNRGYVGALQTYRSRNPRRADTDSLHRLPNYPLEEMSPADSINAKKNSNTEPEAEAEWSDFSPQFSV